MACVNCIKGDLLKIKRARRASTKGVMLLNLHLTPRSRFSGAQNQFQLSQSRDHLWDNNPWSVSGRCYCFRRQIINPWGLVLAGRPFVRPRPHVSGVCPSSWSVKAHPESTFLRLGASIKRRDFRWFARFVCRTWGMTGRPGGGARQAGSA